jgi:chromosome segregation ATPase
MWMLDVFCCALGCVTLLWLDKTRQAAISAEESEKVSMELTETQQSLFDATHENLQLNAHIDEVSDQLALARKDRDALARQLALVREERDKTAKNLAVAEDQVKATAAELLEAKEKIDVAAKATRATTAELIAAKKKIEEAAQSSTKLRSQVAAAEEELQKKQKDLESLTRKITKAQTETEELQILLREREQLQAASAKAATAASEKAAALEKKYADAEKRVDSLSRGQTRITELEKELNRDNAMIVDLQGEKAKLADKLNKIQIESEQKFAGIAMTGKRVVFLVDMSGSMDRTDYDTLDATKWPTDVDQDHAFTAGPGEIPDYRVLF